MKKLFIPPFFFVILLQLSVFILTPCLVFAEDQVQYLAKNTEILPLSNEAIEEGQEDRIKKLSTIEKLDEEFEHVAKNIEALLLSNERREGDQEDQIEQFSGSEESDQDLDYLAKNIEALPPSDTVAEDSQEDQIEQFSDPKESDEDLGYLAKSTEILPVSSEATDEIQENQIEQFIDPVEKSDEDLEYLAKTVEIPLSDTVTADDQEEKASSFETPQETPTEDEEVKTSDTVELNGDTVEYSVDGNKIIAEGNVVVINKDMRLSCDHIEFSRGTNMAYATGNVRLVMTKGETSEMTGDKLTFNFKTMRGNFDGAKIYAEPYYGYGGKVTKAGENHMKMENNYITTCDLDKPHFRIASKKMDIYPGDKLIARNVRMLIGKLPFLYMPKFTQDLRQKEPLVTFTPGFNKEWGMFLLSDWRYYISENFKGIVHVDARERRDIAWGVDLDYKVPQYGDGRVRTYYLNERRITSKRFYEERPSPTIEKERFGVEWRHKWEPDKQTDIILQYSKQSDTEFLKDYFERNFDEDSSPETFFLATRTLPAGTVSFRTDVRVNRFESKVERLPEIRYDLANQSIFDTGFYIRNTTSYANLTSKAASPSEVRPNTMRVDTDSDVSYPIKVGFIETRPFVGGRYTYYSKTKDPDEYGSLRAIFRTGADLSTRFYKVYDVEVEKFGMDIHRLRHIVSPSVGYVFSSLPTQTPDQLDFFDSVDTLDIIHNLNFAIENKLQTKRKNKSVDLMRAIIETDFRLKEHRAKGGFDKINVDIDLNPTDWISFFFDSTYDTQEEFLSTANFDMYINGGNKWSIDIGKRWNRDVDDQLTAAFEYKFNPKWALRTYTRFDLRNGILKEQEYTLTRDLHEWTMDINFNETRREGDEIWLVFTLKAFPDMVIDFGTSFNKRKPGSQSSEGD